jgi:hypothetical protein
MGNIGSYQTLPLAGAGIKPACGQIEVTASRGSGGNVATQNIDQRF